MISSARLGSSTCERAGNAVQAQSTHRPVGNCEDPAYNVARISKHDVGHSTPPATEQETLRFL